MAYQPNLIVELLQSLHIYNEKAKCFCCHWCFVLFQSPVSSSELMGHKRHSQYLVNYFFYLHHTNVTLGNLSQYGPTRQLPETNRPGRTLTILPASSPSPLLLVRVFPLVEELPFLRLQAHDVFQPPGFRGHLACGPSWVDQSISQFWLCDWSVGWELDQKESEDASRRLFQQKLGWASRGHELFPLNGEYM